MTQLKGLDTVQKCLYRRRNRGELRRRSNGHMRAVFGRRVIRYYGIPWFISGSNSGSAQHDSLFEHLYIWDRIALSFNICFRIIVSRRIRLQRHSSTVHGGQPGMYRSWWTSPGGVAGIVSQVDPGQDPDLNLPRVEIVRYRSLGLSSWSCSGFLRHFPISSVYA